ncbi:trp operon leader peptide [Escherichia coli]|uniref:trp operon leader peptide n=1 Tax=Escherichia coli TaxID=562 RepID=A0A1Q6B979_ECOLX|nr:MULTISPECIES: trp operon leader peptide [Escherichia]EJE8661235.1 trp operon leader peptide [Shigella sonnei]EGI7081641.1 trp operon leader peptide [Escherichia coli]EGO3567111.1 trp operon leader peptide [Escherichia coli]EGO5197745.1 trp operon leader peptide [Escherichia coli]EGO5213624.1 trp operon leader peptide [Escherichia coli]
MKAIFVLNGWWRTS